MLMLKEEHKSRDRKQELRGIKKFFQVHSKFFFAAAAEKNKRKNKKQKIFDEYRQNNALL